MAEIKIEKKKPIWPWLLAALVVLALLAYVFMYDNDDRLAENDQETTDLIDNTNAGTSSNPDPAVASYVQYVKNDPDKMGLDHSYANEALTRLAEAVKAKADQIGYDATTDLNQVKEYADKIATDPFETSHANSIRKATDMVTTTLQNMQQAQYPQLSGEVDELRQASAAIDPDVLTLDQKQAVKAYFDKASDVLQDMN
ncbi:hypothetical protein [Salmonirosea aquatica]|uniref:Uncharacterized protein n=1 Tax=Salmonirosea aquatica TaxID=2654236 RepID=A0A7C9BEE4_9BACT|nr:hypothetical protein [Cytophagaceae bacterium SJW1-29]